MDDSTNFPVSPNPNTENSQQSQNSDPVYHDNTSFQQPVDPNISQAQPPVEESIQRRDITQNPLQFSQQPFAQQPASPVTEKMTASSPAVHDEEESGGGLPKPIKLGLIAGGVLLLIIILFGLFSFIGGMFKGSSQKVTLTYWGLWEDPNVMQGVINDFQRENPNISINYTKQDPKEYDQRLLTRVNNGNGPDIFRYHSSWVPMLLPILSPLPTNVVTPEDFNKLYYPVVPTDLVQSGAIYGIPLEIDTLALFTNTDLFKKANIQAPTTWTDFISDAKALTVKDSSGKIQIAGAALGTFDNINHASDIMSMLFAQNGANMRDLSKTQQNASDALTFYTSFVKSDSNVWDTTLDPSLNAFSKGNLAMFFGYSWDIFTIKALNPTLQYTVHPVPHLPGRDMSVASYWVEGVSNKSPHQKEAFLFMKYLTRKEVQQKLYSEEAKIRPFGELYSRVDLADLLKTNTLIYPFIQQAPNAVSAFFTGETQDLTGIDAQVNAYLGNAIRSVLGNTSADTAISTLSQGVTQVLQKYASH